MILPKETIAHEMRRVLDEEFARWYPLCIDTTFGGFLSDLTHEWKLAGKQDKMIVTQARHVWSTANAAVFYQKNDPFLTIAAHGAKFLIQKMWDKTFGGFYDLVDVRGEPLTENGQIIKRAYGNAFAIYGLAAYARVSGNAAALRMAQEAFQWLESHSYDSAYGGYFQFMSREGTPFLDGYGHIPPKDQNSTIHLLEAFTELYGIWPEPVLRTRLQSLLHIVRDTITTEKGYMVLYFQRDWTPVSFRDSSAAVRESNYELDHVSFGHDVETAYLMLEASAALGLENDTTTLRVAKTMVDHVVRYGWDNERGGVYDGGYYVLGSDRPLIVRNTKEWWAQVEAFNALLMMSGLFPDDELHYGEKFVAQWEYCKNYVIDRDHGGWYWGGIDSVPANRFSPKGSIWKGNYHTSRALINCIHRLERRRVS